MCFISTKFYLLGRLMYFLGKKNEDHSSLRYVLPLLQCSIQKGSYPGSAGVASGKPTVGK